MNHLKNLIRPFVFFIITNLIQMNNQHSCQRQKKNQPGIFLPETGDKINAVSKCRTERSCRHSHKNCYECPPQENTHITHDAPVFALYIFFINPS